jgi:glutathione reductase (NADPH)
MIFSCLNVYRSVSCWSAAAILPFELAHIAVRAGTDVTILHQGDQALEEFAPNMVSLLVDHSRRLGVNIHVGYTVTRVEKSDAALHHP